jgi:hypothetical protein
MARTRTVKLVTGGKAPRKDLHTIAARRPKSKQGKVRRPRRFKPGSKSDLPRILKLLTNF